MSDFPRFEFSMKEVLRAGEALAGAVPWNNKAEAEEAKKVFRVAHNWRDSHAYPMRVVRQELIGQMQRQKLGVAGATGARLKRMPSIRRKLANIPGNLNQMNDLAGCRVILPSMWDVETFLQGFRNRTSNEVFREYPYIQEMKPDGYRSHHMILKFRGSDEAAVYQGRRVEIQIRTQLQHSWATAVEAVGLYRREDLKAGRGDPDWLRLFRLMSEEFAVEEACEQLSDERLAEITVLEKKLDAVETLERLSQAFAYSESVIFDPRDKPDYFQIEYNRAEGKVHIRPFFGPIYATMSYDAAELRNAESGSGETKIVLVEVDEIENLRTAYPNYFGDVQKFKSKLRKAASLPENLDRSIPVQERVKRAKQRVYDLGWLRGYKRWK
ncbi:ppGpp synthetase/RelA/SpoT-type nucleotidyltransferase [Bradyrhizobium sp. LB7.1]